MSDQSDIDRVWTLMKKIDMCMLTTRDGERISSRPMSSLPKQNENAVYFLSDEQGPKNDQVQRDGHVLLIFAEPDKGKFLTVSGQARVSADRELIKALWSSDAEAWWSGPDDPSVRVIEVTPDGAQFWEGPHGLVATIQMLAAATTAVPPAIGEQRKVDLH